MKQQISFSVLAFSLVLSASAFACDDLSGNYSGVCTVMAGAQTFKDRMQIEQYNCNSFHLEFAGISSPTYEILHPKVMVEKVFAPDTTLESKIETLDILSWENPGSSLALLRTVTSQDADVIQMKIVIAHNKHGQMTRNIYGNNPKDGTFAPVTNCVYKKK